jgi:sulfoxide reductase catalytic subunit YedY
VQQTKDETMLIKLRKRWEMAERDATPEAVFRDRRRVLAGMAGLGGGILAQGTAMPAFAAAGDGLYPAKRNPAFVLDRPLSKEALVKTYNNFYEFGSHKQISRAAQKLKISPWTITIRGMVEKDITIDFDDLVKKVDLEERLYRHRCVEAWSMAVPWTGFPMRKLLELARPQSSAKYVVMRTFKDTGIASGQKQFWYPWPYTEGLTIEEAANDLAFMATGVYGKPMPKQMGAPIRLTVPWKYGFKSIKSIVDFELTDKRPVSFWQTILPREYGFWANVNPKVPHPRWTQATERPLGSNEKVPTLLFNGYAEEVAGLYKDIKSKKLFM